VNNENVACDSCPWQGKASELDTVELKNGDESESCPACGDLSISHLGFDE